MKANRKFVNEEEAVSAVIGVILMVAITVAIAATVYVYVSGMLGGTTQSTPTVSMVVDNTNDKLTVNKADPGLSWSDFKIKTDTANTVVNFSGQGSTTVGTTLTTITSIYSGAGDVTAGDYFKLSGVTGNVKVTLVYTPTNAIVGEWTVTV